MKTGYLLIVAMIVCFGTAAAASPLYQWHTFYGSGGFTSAEGVAIDNSGNVYIAGYSSNSWNGPAGQTPLNPFNVSGGVNSFVAKLNSSGAYQWHTFYGSGGGDTARGIEMDSSGGVYVMGESPAAWDGPTGQAPLHAWSSSPGCSNLFILKLNGNGTYQWHTFHGPPGNGDYCNGTIMPLGIAIDGTGNVYVTGDEWGNWLGPEGQPPVNPHNDGYTYNPFVLKLDSSGTYQWHTFYGYHDNGGDTTNAIAVDSSGGVFVTGTSSSAWNGPGTCSTPGTPPCPLHEYSNLTDPYGSTNIFVLKLTSSGVYQWHTYYGAGASDGYAAFAMAVDASSNVYVTGWSSTDWNGPGTCSTPGTSPCPLNGYSDSASIFVLKLAGDGAYQWHTFYGSGGVIGGHGIALDSGGGAYVTGASWYNWKGPGNKPPLYGGGDFVILKLTSSGTYQWHSFFGSGNDVVTGIAMHGNSDAYVTGYSENGWNGPDDTSPLHPHDNVWNSRDLFVLKMSDLVGIPATVTTGIISNVTFYSANVAGTVISDGGSTVTARGVCWSVNAVPTTAGSHTSDGGGIGSFTSAITGLSPYTTYFARAYATNSAGTSYGDNLYFTTLCPTDVARIGTNGYTTLQSAIDSITGSADVRAVAGVCSGGLTIDGSRSVKLVGGYDCVCNTLIGVTSVRGKLTIKSPARVAVSNLVIN